MAGGINMTPSDIAALLAREGSGQNANDFDESAQPEGSRQRRTEMLVLVLDVVQRAWFSGSADVDLMAEMLGDGARDVAWRGPMGDSGLLGFFLGILAVDDLRQGLYVHTLRLIGNSCADTDENRARVVQGDNLPTIIRLLRDMSLIPFTIPVLFNILVDYEPAQLQASQCQLNLRLVALLASPNLPDFAPFITYFSKILGLLITQEGEAALADPRTVTVLLTVATSPPCNDDLDDFTSLVSAATAYLGSEAFQAALIAGPDMPLFLAVVSTASQALEVLQLDDPDLEGQLIQLRTALLTALTDITGNDSFTVRYPISSPVRQTLWALLRTPNVFLQTAACLALGNISRSDEVSTTLVQTHHPEVLLSALISDPATRDSQLLHAALSFLKNLAIPAENKLQLGVLLEPNCVPRIYSLDTIPQVQFAAVSLTRLLVLNCPENVSRFCAPLTEDQSSPRHERTSIHTMMSLYERTDAEPTKLEVARCILAICRVLHTAPVTETLPDWQSSSDTQSPTPPKSPSSVSGPEADSDGAESKRRQIFYRRHRLGAPLVYLITQEKWPALRSEAWFVFALMSRSKDAAAAINGVMRGGGMRALIETLTGRKLEEWQGDGQLELSSSETPSQDALSVAENVELEPQLVDPKHAANMLRVDRENALVLCTELLKNWGSNLGQLRRNMIEDLVKEGTELLIKSKEGQENI